MDLATLRHQLPVTQHCCYFQTGSLGPSPVSQQALLRQAHDAFQQYGPASPDVLEIWGARAEQSRVRLAEFLGTTADSLAWISNSSYAIRAVFANRQWSPGDEILTSALEHVGTRMLWDGLAHAYGVQTQVVPTVDDDATFLAQLADRLTPRTRMLFLSHISCVDGRRLPIAEAIKIARERDVLVLIDGAQAPGQIPVNLTELDPDYYIGSTHKWLLGPLGLGYIYVGKRGMPSFNPQLTPLNGSTREFGERFQNPTAAARGETGTTDIASRVSLIESLNLLESVGVSTIEQHVRELAAYFRAGLAELPQITMISNLEPERSSGIISFVVNGWQPQQHRDLVEKIYHKRRILIKYQIEFSGIRVSIAGFNTREEVDRLLEALHHYL